MQGDVKSEYAKIWVWDDRLRRLQTRFELCDTDTWRNALENTWNIQYRRLGFLK